MEGETQRERLYVFQIEMDVKGQMSSNCARLPQVDDGVNNSDVDGSFWPEISLNIIRWQSFDMFGGDKLHEVKRC